MPKILYFAVEDWLFCRHFLPMARAARAAGFDVAVATRVRKHAERIVGEGFRVISLENERRSLGPIEIVRSLIRMARILRAERPALVHCINLRMVVLGGLAAKFVRAHTLILAPTGLGHLWIADGVVVRLARTAVRVIVGRVLRGPHTHYLFENGEDPREFGLDPHGTDVTLVGGAGIDPADFAESPQPPAPPVKVAVVARMLKPKGIAESVAAVHRARRDGMPIELHLFGEPDPSNRTSFTSIDLQTWAREPGIHWHGATADVAAVWRDHHVALLLSYREGLPLSLVEASAAARPIVATDVTGCREVVRDGIEGFLVPLGNIEAAANALVRLARDAVMRARMGAAARARFRERFAVDQVMATVGGLYRTAIPGMLARDPAKVSLQAQSKR
jgi:glycosyltransferase involved in cell wall biosynthesis